jgi:hypothetical protein
MFQLGLELDIVTVEGLEPLLVLIVLFDRQQVVPLLLAEFLIG